MRSVAFLSFAIDLYSRTVFGSSVSLDPNYADWNCDLGFRNGLDV